jgi:putative transposase
LQLRELAAERRRFGYRRLGWMLERKGTKVKLNREEGLAVRRRRGRRRAIHGLRVPLALPQAEVECDAFAFVGLAANQRWSLDFMADQLANGRRFRILTVVDDFTRECLATVIDTSLPGVRVVQELDRLVAERGRPAAIVSDNGSELTGHAILRWVAERAIDWHYISPQAGAMNA